LVRVITVLYFNLFAVLLQKSIRAFVCRVAASSVDIASSVDTVSLLSWQSCPVLFHIKLSCWLIISCAL